VLGILPLSLLHVICWLFPPMVILCSEHVRVMVGHRYARRRRARDIRRDAERAARATDEAEDTDMASG